MYSQHNFNVLVVLCVEVPGFARLFLRMTKVELKRIAVWRIGGIIVIRKTELLGHLSTTKFIRTGPAMNQTLREQRPATNGPRHCTDTRSTWNVNYTQSTARTVQNTHLYPLDRPTVNDVEGSKQCLLWNPYGTHMLAHGVCRVWLDTRASPSVPRHTCAQGVPNVPRHTKMSQKLALSFTLVA
jgi:hypothetical protein